MIDNDFWLKVADKWITKTDGIEIPDDSQRTKDLVKKIKDEFLVMGGDDANMQDILDEFGFDFDDD